MRAPPFLNKQKEKTEERNMKRQNTDSVQNRFTAYLIAAVVHQRMRYMEKKKLLLQKNQIAKIFLMAI